MSKEENVIKYYVLCNKLKDVIRTGWLEFGQRRYPYDDNFMAVSNYVKDNKIIIMKNKIYKNN